MTAKEYLLQIEVMTAKISNKKQRLQEYKELALGCGGFDYSKERVQTSNLGGQIEQAIVRYVSLEQDILDDIVQLQQKKDQITNEIHRLNDVRYIQILYRRYVECKKLKEVSEDMHYDYDYIRALHSRALQEFENVNLHTQSHI